jgi:hypothetical protein
MLLRYLSSRPTIAAGKRWLDRPFFPVIFSWRMFSRTPAMRIHRAVIRASFPRHPRLRWIALAGNASFWPIKACLLTRRYSRQLGPGVAERTGKGLNAQRWEQLRLAALHSISPESYYTYGLHRPDRYGRAIEYLHYFELTYLQRALDGGDAGARILADKTAVCDLLSRHAVPTVRCHAIAEGGVVRYAQAGQGGLPLEDLFIKPVTGRGGIGAMIWEHDGSGRYRSTSVDGTKADENPRELSADDLVRLVQRLSMQQPWMIEERLQNHPELADLSPRGTASIRILTGRIDGRSEVLRATFKMPLGDAIVSNSGLNAPVDLETGTLGPATEYGPTERWFSRHPDTNAVVEGRVIPDWPACLSAVEHAHDCVPEVTFIGWDVVVTPRGPVVLEGNWGWDPVSLQKPQSAPLLDGRFAEICTARLDEAVTGPNVAHAPTRLRRARRFFSLPPARRALYLRAAGTTALIRIGLWALHPRTLLRYVADRVERVREKGAAERIDSPEEVARAVQRVARRIPRASCLTQALAAQLLLARQGTTSELCIGVTRTTGEFTAHAWVEIEGSIVSGGPVDQYVRMPSMDLSLFA